MFHRELLFLCFFFLLTHKPTAANKSQQSHSMHLASTTAKLKTLALVALNPSRRTEATKGTDVQRSSQHCVHTERRSKLKKKLLGVKGPRATGCGPKDEELDRSEEKYRWELGSNDSVNTTFFDTRKNFVCGTSFDRKGRKQFPLCS